MHHSHRKLKTIAILLCAVLLFGAFPAVADSVGDVEVHSAQLVTDSSPENGMVRVFLSSMGNPSRLNLTTQGSYLINGDTSRPVASGSSLVVNFSSVNGSLTLTHGGSTYQMGSYFILRRTGTASSNGIKIQQSKDSANPYPGDLSFRAVRQSSGSYKLYTVAHVYIEDYLYGVVPYEMGNSSAIEALKAQAVAARTYTVRMMHSRTSGYYDVVDTTSDQVYRGTPSGNDNCKAAVDATRGIVLKYNGSYVSTYYSASNGGQTESLKNVNGNSSHPYLTVKDDPFDYNNPSSLVKKKTIYTDLQSGSNPSTFISRLRTKAVTALQKKGYNATTYNTTLLRLTNVAPHTPKYASPSRLYTKMDFTVTAITGNGVTATATVTFGIFSELESLFSMSIQSSSNELWSARKSGNSFVLEARRYGHGYGMSQRGAMYMGKLGYTYDQILGFYYEGATRVRQSFTNKVLNPESGMDDVQIQPPADIPTTDSTACTGVVKLVSNSGTLAVRKEKSVSSQMIGGLGSGAIVSVIHNDGSWCYISYGNIKGYVPADSLQITGTPSGEAGAGTSIQGFATVTANDFVNLRSGPGMGYNRVTTAPNGSVLTVFSVSGSWAHVQYGNTVAYVNTPYISAVSSAYPQPVTGGSGNAVVTTASGTGTVNLRETASTSARVLTQVRAGEPITILSDDGSWARVRYGGLEGYMMSQFLRYDGDASEPPAPSETPAPEATPPAAAGKTVYISVADTPLYERAQAESSRLAVLPLGTEAELLSSADGWSLINVRGLTGYVLSANLNEQKPDASTPPPTATTPPPSGDIQLARVTTASGSLNLRMEPSVGSRVLTTIPQYATVTVTSYGTEWCAVSYGGLSGYAMTTFLTLESSSGPTPAPETPPQGDYTSAVVTTASGSLNLREEPRSGSRILRTIPRNASVQVNSYGASWCNVTYGDTTGYVMTTFLRFVSAPENTPSVDPSTPAPSEGKAIVTTASGSLNLRESGHYGAAVIVQIPQYAEVDVLQRGANWTKVRYHVFEGYVVTSFLTFTDGSDAPATPTPTPETPTQTDTAWVSTPSGSLNLRQEPSSSARVLMQIPRGAQLTVLNRSDSWCRVTYQGVGGYVMTSYLSFTGAPASEATPTPAGDPTSAPADEPANQPTPEPTAPPTEAPVQLSTQMDVLSQKENALIAPADGDRCTLYADSSLNAAVVDRLEKDAPVVVWMKGPDWCLVQYDLADPAKLAYCLTKDLQMTGE
ncbi:MAG: SH3 domain-containing protein [Clostridia bacterium]|nr:SH3 domain-containing protein [Clostridia bacterium]